MAAQAFRDRRRFLAGAFYNIDGGWLHSARRAAFGHSLFGRGALARYYGANATGAPQ